MSASGFIRVTITGLPSPHNADASPPELSVLGQVPKLLARTRRLL